MNWKSALRGLLGKFWSLVFGEHDFILWVENLFSLLARCEQRAYDRAAAERALSLSGVYQDRLPYEILLVAATHSGGDSVSGVGHPANSLLDVLGGADPAGLREKRGWVLRSRCAMPAPDMLTDHVVGASCALFAGLDFDVVGKDGILFYTPPDELGLDTVCLADGDGAIVEYYRLFGWTRPASAVEDAVAAFESPALNYDAELAWSVHQNGATVLSAERLLGGACGSVVCAEDGVIDDMWSEEAGALRCMVVGGRLYQSRELPAALFSIGDRVRAGDVLFGAARFYSGELSAGASEVPGVYVMTDAGEVFARNQDDRPSVPLGGGAYALGVEADAGVLEAYRDRCAKLIESGAPAMPVPASCNPCKFILDRLRAGCYVLMSSTASDMPRLSAALSCIRRSSVAAGMFQAYLRADAEPVEAGHAEMSGSALRAAVAVSVTAGVREAAARARVFL